MKFAMFGLTLLGFLATNRAEAGAILYNTTDLGPGLFKMDTSSDGTIYGLTKSDGSVTYAFDKSPTTTTTNVLVPPTEYNDGVNKLQTLTLQNGNYRVGYDLDTNYSDNKRNGTGDAFVYPTFEQHNGNWFTIGGGLYSPISDMNGQGQVVGKSWIPGTNPYDQTSYFAAFSAIGAQAHGGDAAISDNLNDYIAQVPGFSLISAVKIDDLGRIIALGVRDGSYGDYLLTPTSLGGVATVPEPTSIAILGLGLLLTVAQKKLKKRKARRA